MAEKNETHKVIQELNVVWVLFSLVQIYLIAIGRDSASGGIFNIVISFLLLWFVGQYVKNREAVDKVVIGEETKGQWER